MNNLKELNLNLINLIISSIVPFLILGPFFPDLIVSLSSLYFLYFVFLNKNLNYFSVKPLIIFFIFCIYCIAISFFFAKDILLSLESSLFYFRIGIFACFIWYLIDRDRSILVYFYYSLIICFSVLVIDGYYQYFTGANILGYIVNNGPRISSFFNDELILGSYLSRLFPLLFALFLIKQKQKYEVYFIGLLFILVDVLIYMSGERAAFFFLNLSTIFIIILIKDYQKFRLMTFILAIFFIFILSLNSNEMANRMFKEPAKNIGLIKGSNEAKIFTYVHDSHYRTAYAMFKEKPLFGQGPKMFRILCKDDKYVVGDHPCSSHPHNFYIQLLAETGIIGFLFLFSALIYVFFAALKQLKTIVLKQKRHLSDYQVCLLAGILITVWPLTPNGNFFSNWLIIVYSLPLGFYLQSIYSKEK